MTCYLLLRHNVETGPFTLEQLSGQVLKPHDLIWIEGESIAWKYPSEIPALRAFVQQEDPEDHQLRHVQPSAILTTSKGIFVALPPQRAAQEPVYERSPSIDTEAIELETRFSQPLSVLKERYDAAEKEEPFQFRKTFSKPHAALWLGCLFAGLLAAAFIINKLVAAYDENGSEVIAATAHPVTDMGNSKSSPEEYQNALTTEMVPVDTATMLPVRKAPAKVNLKKLVRLEANDYQVGLFGGIKKLRLLVTNKSAFMLNKVSIELQYLKPNGTVLTTENLTLKSVLPNSSKSLAVSSNNRGVKVAYRITGIQPKAHSENIVSL